MRGALQVTETARILNSVRESRLPKPSPKVQENVEEKPKKSRGLLAVSKPLWYKDKQACKIWFKHARRLTIAGLLTPDDADQFAIYCNLFAEYQEDPKKFSGGKIQQMRILAEQFGMAGKISRQRIAQRATGSPRSLTSENETPAPEQGGQQRADDDDAEQFFD